MPYAPRLHHFPDAGIEVFAIALETQVKRHVIDARAEIIDLLNRHADVGGQMFCCALHAVAQPHRLDCTRPVQRPTVHRHGIDVVEVQDVGAEFLHVAGHVQQHGDGAQPAHDAANAQRVGDGLAQTVAFGDLEIGDRGGLVTADLDHVDGVISAVEGGAAVGCRFDGRVHAQRPSDFAGDDFDGVQPVGIDIVQSDGRIAQLSEAEDVNQQVFGEDNATCADEGDFWHEIRGEPGAENGGYESRGPPFLLQ